MAIAAALVAVRTKLGEGAWIEQSCWDALVEAARADIAVGERGETLPPMCRGSSGGNPCTTTCLSSDGEHVLLGAVEPKFWNRCCQSIGRADLIGRSPPAQRYTFRR